MLRPNDKFLGIDVKSRNPNKSIYDVPIMNASYM